MKRKDSIYFIIFSVVLLIIFSTNYFSKVIDNALDYDEVDYVTSAKFGFAKNALSFHSPNLFEFIEMGKFKLENDTTAINELLKTYPNQSKDPFFLRHYHPVLPIYYWNLISKLNFQPEDKFLRIFNLLIYFLTFAILVFASLFVIKKSNKNFDFGILFLAVSTFLLTYPFLYTFSSLNFHTFFGLSSIYFFYSYELFKIENSKNNLINLGISSALLVLVFETSLFFLAIILLSEIIRTRSILFWIQNKSLFYIIPFVIVTSIFWPAFFTKLEYGKTAGMYLYRIFGKSNEEYGSIDYLDIWIQTIQEYKDFFILSFFLLVFIFFNRTSKVSFPFILLGGLGYLVFMTPFLLNKTYIYPGLALITFFLIVNLSTIVVKLNFKITLLILQFLIVLSSLNKNKNSFAQRNLFNENLELISSLIDKEDRVLVQDGHIFNYYLKTDKLEILDIPEKNGMKFKLRFDFIHRDISNEVIQGKYDYVILYNTPLYNELYEKLKDNYVSIEKNEILYYFKNKALIIQN